jgi:hypothetical protein
MFSICGLLLNAKRLSMVLFRAIVVSMIRDSYSRFIPLSRAKAEATAIAVELLEELLASSWYVTETMGLMWFHHNPITFVEVLFIEIDADSE